MCKLGSSFRLHQQPGINYTRPYIDQGELGSDVNTDKRHHIVIIGCGPTALGAAQRLDELQYEFKNFTVTILEQRDDKGFLWDMGGHVVFSHYEYFDRTLDRAVPGWNQRVRAASAFMKGSDSKRRFIPYPVQNNIEAMDKDDQEKCLSGLEEITRHPITGKPASFDQWLMKHFGVGLCDVFMRKYNKKVWTVDTSQMNSDWVGERVAVPDVNKIKARIAEFDKGVSVKDSAWGPNRLFRFPSVNVTGAIWKGVAKLIPREWFKFQSKVTGVDLDSKALLLKSEGPLACNILKYDTLISTAPLDKFVKRGREVKTSALVSRRSWVRIPPKSPVKVVFHRHSESTGYTVLYTRRCRAKLYQYCLSPDARISPTYRH